MVAGINTLALPNGCSQLAALSGLTGVACLTGELAMDSCRLLGPSVPAPLPELSMSVPLL